MTDDEKKEAEENAKKAAITKRLMDWIALHDKNNIRITGTGDAQNLQSGNVIRPVRRVNLTHNTIFGGGDLYLYFAFETTNDYQSVLGYFVKAGRVKCRHFYRSRSESAWRAGTGIRTGGGWVKSAEGHASHKYSGYIMEGMLPRELEVALDNFHQAQANTEWTKGDWTGIILDWARIGQANPDDGDERSKRLFGTYFVLNGPGPSGIINEYAGEREYVSVMGDDSNYIQADSADPELETGSAKLQDIGSVRMQRNFRFRTAKPVIDNRGKENDIDSRVLEYKGDISYRIKQAILTENFENRNFPGLLDVMNNPMDGDYYNQRQIYHTAMGITYNYYTYRYRPYKYAGYILIEIAYTNLVGRLYYQGNDGAEKYAYTPTCWVRNCYIEGELTSFGSFKKIAIDMAFLVQKPCDYVGQTSNDIMEILGVEKSQGDQNVAIPVREKGIQKLAHAQNNIIRGGYLSLAVFNESTSPLLRLFKIRQGFPLFKNKFKAGSIAFKPELEPAQLRMLVLAGINDYISFHEDRTQTKAASLAVFRNTGTHGSVGLDRARELRTLIENAEQNLVVLHVFNFFANGQVGDRKMSTGVFGHKIQANPYSLFTQIAVRIIGYYCYDPDPDQQHQDKINKFAQVPANSRVRFSSPGRDKCIQRMLNKALSEDIPKGETYASWVRVNAPMLLEAFKK